MNDFEKEVYQVMYRCWYYISLADDENYLSSTWHWMLSWFHLAREYISSSAIRNGAFAVCQPGIT